VTLNFSDQVETDSPQNAAFVNLRANSILLVLSCYFLATMEWLFFATMPSFLSIAALSEQVLALLVTPLFILAYSGIAFLLFALLTAVIKRYVPKFPNLIVLVPAAIAAIAAMLMFDNFTYTVFGIGIVNSRSSQSYLYAALVILTFSFFAHRFSSISSKQGAWLQRQSAFRTTLVLVTVSILATISGGLVVEFREAPRIVIDPVSDLQDLPNIVFFSADGIDAKHLSVYGYHRDTTPHLVELLSERGHLIAESAFSNGARTTGSLTSMFSGKHPLTTKVLFPPHVLTGRDSYEHLPGILKALGYSNFQESARYYADAFDLNWRRGFDIANNRRTAPFLLEQIEQKLPMPSQLFRNIADRTNDRALHITQIQNMENHYAQVAGSDTPTQIYGTDDDVRIERAIQFLSKAKAPFLLHLHLMDSHCCGYRIGEKHFSIGRDVPMDTFDQDFMDDVILESDHQLGTLIAALEQFGQLENTLFVYSSDHNREWGIKARVPLIFIWPNFGEQKIVSHNSQLLDVAPTILDFINQPIPGWMEGVTLLGNQITDRTSLFGFSEVVKQGSKVGSLKVSRLVGAGPPLYGLQTFVEINCSDWFELDILTNEISSGLTDAPGSNCQSKKSHEDARASILEFLSKSGFKSSDLVQ